MPQGEERYEELSPKSYEHPADRAATSAIHSIPLMDKVLKRLTDVGHERRLHQVLVGNAVRIGEHQVPQLWGAHERCAASLDVAPPPLYATQTPIASALTIGAHRPMVVVASELVANYEPDETQAVLAHEMGHVLSEHYYYTTAFVLLSEFLRTSVPGPLTGLPIRAMYLALLEWSRAAELSADRASALVMGDPLVVCRMLMRMAGGAIDGMSLDAFITQATEYEDEEDLFARWSRAWVEIALTHPFAVRRVRELIGWVGTGEFDRIRDGSYVRRGHEPATSKEFEAAVAHYRERFANMLERTTGGVSRLVSQLEDWLRGPSQEAESADVDDDV